MGLETQYGLHGQTRGLELRQRADDLFEWVWLKGQVKRKWALISHEDRAIPLLEDAFGSGMPRKIKVMGRMAIRVDSIVGTVGSLDFDRDFYPRYRRMKERWSGVAVAMLTDRLSLPPIFTIRYKKRHYVNDGNHRVSVARSLGWLFIDAEVIRWKH